jgi:pheromone shutdown protein TraB
VVDKKIPLLTEVYQPKPMAAVENESKPRHDDTALITPELIARIAAHIKPRLEADLAKTVTENVRQALKAELLQELQDEVIHTQASIEARTVDFVDKTKADLKTELPRMYQSSADLVYGNLEQKFTALQASADSIYKSAEQKLAALQSDAELANSTVEQKITSLQIDAVSKADVMLSSGMQAAVENANRQINANVEALQVEVSARMMRDMNAEMNALQAQAISIHQTQLGQELTNVFESLNQNANTNLQEQARALQADALAQMRSNFIEAMPEIYVSAVAEQQDAVALEISQQLTAEMQAFQAKSFTTHQAQLGEALTSSFQVLNENAKQDLQAQMSLLQADVLTQMRGTMNEAIPSIYEAAVDEVKAKFVDEMSVQTIQMRDSFLATVNADLPAVQEVIRENIQHILAASLPVLENDLRNQLTSELQDLLLTVKFVLPK